MRFIMLLALILASTACLKAQESTCGDVIFEDAQMPTYAPIARAAHIQGIVRFEVHLNAAGGSEIKLVDGPQFLAGTAQSYISARRHYWATGGEHKPCSYVAKIEYRIIEPQSDATNNFHRVTVLGPGYTLVETQTQKPSCMDCVSDECSMDGVSESKATDISANGQSCSCRRGSQRTSSIRQKGLPNRYRPIRRPSNAEDSYRGISSILEDQAT